MRLRVVPMAQQQIREAAGWWRTNRPAAPNAIVDELRRVFRLLRVHPAIGACARNPGFDGVRRVLVARVGYHVYYRIGPAGDVVEILAFWHSRRGAGPPR